MEFRQLESFCAVVRYQSFTKAAEKLYISQPTISTHIRMLEQEFNSRLIIRTTKNIEITPHGKELFAYAQKIFTLKNDLIQKWSEENKKIIRIGASTIPADYILPEVLPLFCQKYPDIQLHIHQNDSGNILQSILNGKFTIGMVGMKSFEKELDFVPFFHDEIVMITPKQEKFLHFAQKAFNQDDLISLLKKETIILREQGSGSKKRLESYFEQINLSEKSLNIIARLNDQESIKKLVASGLGISFISAKAITDADNLLTIKLPENNLTRSLYFAYHKDYILKEHILSFIKFVQKFYAKK
ncbi:selenium metabolism-associated LysR family transcriptional regulator [Megamonas funiformis]|uniref:selenium metabolism-associated LysR family transcriptional regulator n=1 Tax=Megamonas funiformis TaxID=437897 RepID=UPI001958F7E1|nr:selenium metabolism-associated LysR family transcriptional regulator [Megamonas funiformis]MBM6650827.1 LysR family transcriptional regulator [Megamonas funiformis]